MIEKISLYILPIMILAILCAGIIKKVPVYEEFVEGAKDGFRVSISIIPYLVALIENSCYNKNVLLPKGLKK